MRLLGGELLSHRPSELSSLQTPFAALVISDRSSRIQRDSCPAGTESFVSVDRVNCRQTKSGPKHGKPKSKPRALTDLLLTSDFTRGVIISYRSLQALIALKQSLWVWRRSLSRRQPLWKSRNQNTSTFLSTQVFADVVSRATVSPSLANTATYTRKQRLNEQPSAAHLPRL